VSTEYLRVTDGQTSCDGIVRAMHTRRAVKNIIEFIRTYMSELFSQLYSAILSIAFHQINSG